MIRTQGLNHLTLRIANLDRSIGFYRDLLGFTLRHRGRTDAYLESGLLWLALLERTGAPPQEGPLGLDHFALTIAPPDLDAAVTELRQQQIPIVKGPVVRGAGQSIYFADPDGILIELHTSNLNERMATWK